MVQRDGPDYSQPHVLLPFLAEFVQSQSAYQVAGVRLVRDGSVRFELVAQGGQRFDLAWVEAAGPGSLGAVAGGVAVVAAPAGPGPSRPADAPVRAAAAHLARRLARLLQGRPPDLLQWRNRNLREVIWGKRVFADLCPGALVKGQTRYFDYTVSELDERQGFINLAFQSRRARVRLRLAPAGGRAPAGRVLHAWGPMALLVLEDERGQDERGQVEHQVEEFLGYLLSRNLPARFSLRFERDDPPAGCLPAGHDLDFLQTRRPDDSAFFEMLLAIEDRVGVVCACPQECFNLFVLVSAPKESWTTSAPWQLHPAVRFAQNFSFVRLTDQATVMGDQGTRRCLEALARSADPPDLVIYFDSCLHRLVGEDTQGTLRACWQGSDIPLVYYDIRTTQHPYLKQLQDFWRSVQEQLAPRPPEAEPDRVCFLGLGLEADRQLAGALARLGIRDGGRVFPRFHLAALRDLGRSQLVVGNCWEYVRSMFGDMLAALGRPQAWLPLPYGVRGTGDWLDAVHRALRGAPAPLQDLPELARAEEELELHRRAIRGQRVGLFLRARGAAVSLSPGQRFGVPLLGFLHELGLGVALHLFLGPEERAPDEAALSAALGLDARLGDSLTLFHEAGQLSDLLARGDFSLVYTELFRDRRVGQAGKAPLMLWQLGAGLAGAVASARALRGTLQSGFHRRYHASLPGPREHWAP